MRTPQSKKSAPVLTSALLCFALAACSPSEVTISEDNPYKADFDLALQNATSEFEREVLKDGVITKAEYDEATTRYVDCVKENGISIATKEEYGIHMYAISGDLEAYENEIDHLCSTGTTLEIAALYNDTTMNPYGGDVNELSAQCLIRSGLVEAPFTAADFKDMELSDTLDPKREEIRSSEDFYRCQLSPLYDLTNAENE